MVNYGKIPKISPGAYIFQRPFLRDLFLEGLIFGGAYVRREICVSKSIGLASKLVVNLPFLLCFTLYSRANSKYKSPGGAYIWRGLFSKFYGIYNDNLVCNTNLQRVLKKKNEYKDKMNVTSVRFES